MSAPDRAGGVDWELSEAERLMLEAQTPEERVIAMRRHTEAIRNLMQTALIPSFQQAIGSILEAKLQPLTRQLEQSNAARLNHDAAIQSQIDARFDVFGGELQRIADAVAARPAERAREQAAIEARLTRKRERLDNHEGRIARIERHLGLDDDAAG
jgi:hypothetical protein